MLMIYELTVKECFLGWSRVCQTSPMYKAELTIESLRESEAMAAAVNGSAQKMIKRRAAIDNTPKIANEAIEAGSCNIISTLESPVRRYRINFRNRSSGYKSSCINLKLNTLLISFESRRNELPF